MIRHCERCGGTGWKSCSNSGKDNSIACSDCNGTGHVEEPKQISPSFQNLINEELEDSRDVWKTIAKERWEEIERYQEQLYNALKLNNRREEQIAELKQELEKAKEKAVNLECNETKAGGE